MPPFRKVGCYPVVKRLNTQKVQDDQFGISSFVQLLFTQVTTTEKRQ